MRLSLGCACSGTARHQHVGIARALIANSNMRLMEGFFRADETKHVREVALDRGRSTIDDLSPASVTRWTNSG